MKSFKSALAVVAIALCASAAHADSDDNNGNHFGQYKQDGQNATSMELRGSVAVNCTIGITATAKATSLDILNGEKNTLVGTTTESCNSGNGYTIEVSSTNQGSLVNKANGAVPTAYQAIYDDGAGQIGSKIVANRDKAQFGRQGKLLVSFSGNSQAIAGTYSDIVNLVIAAK
ncbi:MAG: hypothetical protein RIT15_65 [Pseudomonadota bacterium]